MVISCLDRLLEIINIKKEYLLSYSGNISVFIKLALVQYNNRCFSKLGVIGILDPLGQVKFLKGCIYLRDAWGKGSDFWGDPEMPSVLATSVHVITQPPATLANFGKVHTV